MTKHITQKAFKRVETKYLVPQEQLSNLLQELGVHMQTDDFARSTITSLYFDTEDFQMIQDSLAKKYGKEKLRLRTYANNPGLESPAFLEIKQKMAGVGYKYRVKTTPHKAFLALVDPELSVSHDKRMETQLITLQERYGTLSPRMLITYKRLSFKGKADATIRVTLDSALNYAAVRNLTLTSARATPLLPRNQLIMEIKVADKMPSWLEEIIASYQLEKTSFSKYGRAYQLHHQLRIEKEKVYA